MRGKRPLVGVSPWYDYEKNMTYIKKGYCEGIMQTGGVPVLLPMTTDEEILMEAVDRCDGILISGGADVDPAHFGEYNMPYNGEISPYRDVLELFITKKAVTENKPILGICRGIQVMNIALGGTLYQDIYAQIKDRMVLKHSQEAPRWYPTHDIVIEKGSRVWQWFETDRIGVNSFHHQSVKDVAPNFTVTSRAVDGIIESIEHNNHPFAVGVQWHPELMWQENPKFLALFKDLVNACIQAR